MRFKRLVGLALSVVYAAGVQPGVRAGAAYGAQFAATQQPSVAAASGLTISGSVLFEDGSRVANVRLRLRSVDKGTIVAQTVSQDGAFSFPLEDAGLYVVEAVDEDQSVLAVSNALQSTTTSQQTQVTVPRRRAAAFFSSTPFLLLSAAAGAGLIIWTINRDDGGIVPPVSPER